jgi:hypothetical protein
MDGKRPDRMYIRISRGPTYNTGTTMPLSTFTGLTAAQTNAAAMTPVQFAIRAEAGTVAFEGTFRNGQGAGQFTFTPNRAYFDSVRALGIDTTLGGRRRHQRDRDEEDDLFDLAVHDVSIAFIKSMIAEGYRVSLEKYLEMRIFNITPEYIREMRSLGFKDIEVDELVASKIHRVTPQFVREMRAAGWDLSLDELQSSSIHGATPAFAAEMRKLGYGNLTHDELVSFRIHRVDAEFIAAMRKAGYDHLDADDLVSFRIHRVTPEFVAEMRKLGYDRLTPDDLVSMRIHRVTPEFIRELEQAGYVKVPVEKLISMRIHGIDAKMIRKLRD